jgi:hypothetical protein
LVIITTVGPDGTPLAGACYELTGPAALGTVCDNDPTDADPTDGTILVPGVAPGEYLLRQTQPPAGFLAAADQAVAILAGEAVAVTVIVTPAPETGTPTA